MAKPKRYTVRDITTGKILATGTATECGEALGMTNKTVYALGRGDFTSKNYIVTENSPEKEFDTDMREAANKWEAFAGPLRRKYGIPVYKPKREGEENA